MNSDANNLDEWFGEHARLNDALSPYYHHIALKQDGRGNWTSPPTAAEQHLDDLWYFYSAALVNSGDILGNMDYALKHRNAIEAIGAHGCLAAIETLMPYHRAMQGLTTDDAKGDYWWETKDERWPYESLAEDSNDFARLLLA